MEDQQCYRPTGMTNIAERLILVEEVEIEGSVVVKVEPEIAIMKTMQTVSGTRTKVYT
jgi:hypothetical protein